MKDAGLWEKSGTNPQVRGRETSREPNYLASKRWDMAKVGMRQLVTYEKQLKTSEACSGGCGIVVT